MKALVIGGEQNGTWIDVLEGASVWVDIRTASTHRMRRFTWSVTLAATGEVIEAYVMHLAVHQDFLGPQEMAMVSQIFNSIAMNEYARTHGEKQEIVKEPAAADRAPDTPSALFGPDGSPL